RLATTQEAADSLANSVANLLIGF
ncbi:hypothetical protein CCACVL1_16462, partial [Corchorus capsularis]